MRLVTLSLLVFISNLVYSQTNRSSSQKANYDIVVIGGTPAGVAASIAAGRLGKSVMLVEQSPVLGGVLSSGVNRLDDYLVEANSGIMEEWRSRVENYNVTELKNDPVVQHDMKVPDHRWSTAQGRGWEPKTAAKIYAQMVAEVPSIQTRFNEVPAPNILIQDVLLLMLLMKVMLLHLPTYLFALAEKLVLKKNHMPAKYIQKHSVREGEH